VYIAFTVSVSIKHKPTSTITAGVPFFMALFTVSSVPGPPSRTTETSGMDTFSSDENLNKYINAEVMEDYFLDKCHISVI